MKKYIAKRDTWFDEGSEAELLDDYRQDGLDCGLFLGTKDGKTDAEICPFDEFEIIDKRK